MALSIWNTQSKQYEHFTPHESNHVGMYTCGPTVYNYPHIGNYRAYITADIIKRTLLYLGYTVHHVMNITDVDDKTIKESQTKGISLSTFTQPFTDAFINELHALNIILPDTLPKATEHISEMISLIQLLLDKGIAYQGDDGSIYYAIAKAPAYGILSPVAFTETHTRLRADEYSKDNVHDFALWKAWNEADGDVYWDAPFGKGRPGWHIECSAMSMRYLGTHFDIHTGGIDLIFPHHENEIAQSCAATNDTFARYWMHNEWVLVGGKKMSKSLGNQLLLHDLPVSPLAYRLWMLSAHYRSIINLEIETLRGAEAALQRLRLQTIELGSPTMINARYAALFTAALEYDLNTAQALAVMYDLLQDTTIPKGEKKATILYFDTVLGLDLGKVRTPPQDIIEYIQQREEARKNKEYTTADTLRIKIEAAGYTLVDTADGPVVL